MAHSTKPTPRNLKVLQGTARPDREKPDIPEYDLIEVFPEPPQHLNIDGAAMWNDVGPQLVKARVLQTVDLFSLEQLCVSWQSFRMDAKAQRPQSASDINALKGLFTEFGMTPASRRKVASGDEKKKANSFTGNGKRA